MRTYQHVIDTRSVKRVLNLLPDYWVIREFTERDYGIDLMVEIFEKSGTDNHNHEIFESTGAVFNIQIKGTNSKLKKINGTFNYSISKYALLYAESFSTPFFLFRVDISSSQAKSYFIWTQRYIKDVLEREKTSWRTDKQKYFTVKIPAHNEIDTPQWDKIEKIASRPKFIQELVEFRESYFHLSAQLSAASNSQFHIDQEALNHMVLLARQIYNLKIIFKYNSCCIDKSCAKELLEFVEALTVSSNNDDFLNSPHHFNFELLFNSIESVYDIENFIAKNQNDTVY